MSTPYWRDTVAFTGHGSEQFFGVFEAHAAPAQTSRARIQLGLDLHS
ncbi:MAG TPA: hypothetical protein VLZ05_24240 [Mycobacterium sp.]|nr:hypothetical protein [Mycobacterium sp.]HUH71711.1 hypothetical protein [Mycobacterium sp.]